MNTKSLLYGKERTQAQQTANKIFNIYRLLEELKDVAEGYKTMAGALVGESEETIGVETYRGASACKDDYEMKMLKLIDSITGTQSV